MKQVEAGGYEIVHNSDSTDAGTVIINTCGFINDAKQESIDTILGHVRAKQRGDIRDLFVMGCLAERYMDELRNEIPEVSRYFGVNNMNDILSELGLRRRDDLLGDRTITGPGHYAYLKVSEGCDRTCAFCAIPLIRGKCISRTLEEILAEAETLERKGVKELILVAQDLSWYGLDIYRKQALPELVLKLLESTNFEWIRLHYLYPANFPAELIPVIRDNPRVCKYIDIPVQHITDTMLGLMKRSHKRQDTEKLLNTLRKEIPGAVIRTTLIAGHPGETETEYGLLRDFVSSFRFDRLGVFAYSHEEDTYSFLNYNDDIPEDTKQSRVAELMEIQQGISAELNGSYVGKTLKVLIDRRDGEFLVGRTEYDSPEVDQEVLIPVSSGLTPGLFYYIRITKAEEFDLYGVPA
ncbi:MAG: 30S ribosomal protein S12 methylthiotransferase RimO [Bacteroidales bacterium]|nr:30S ribosomal protein S12 methylthiotransferase RimO [Bacteroidales bacterium]